MACHANACICICHECVAINTLADCFCSFARLDLSLSELSNPRCTYVTAPLVAELDSKSVGFAVLLTVAFTGS